MKCWNDHRNQPFFRLMPIRVEQLSSHPFIVMFHDFINDKEIKALKKMSKPLVLINLNSQPISALA